MFGIKINILRNKDILKQVVYFSDFELSLDNKFFYKSKIWFDDLG